MAGPSLHRSRAAGVHPFATPFALLFPGGLSGCPGVLPAIPLVPAGWTPFHVVRVKRAIRSGGGPMRPVAAT